MYAIRSYYGFVYPESYLPVFEHLSLTLSEGWHAIVGANGSGKSTLLELIARKRNNFV